MSKNILHDLYDLALERKDADPDASYMAKLHKRGAKYIAKKFGEEAVEAVIDSQRLDAKPKSDKRRENLRQEYADVLFHMTVLMAHQGITFEEVYEALSARKGTSGIAEKASRKKD